MKIITTQLRENVRLIKFRGFFSQDEVADFYQEIATWQSAAVYCIFDVSQLIYDDNQILDKGLISIYRSGLGNPKIKRFYLLISERHPMRHSISRLFEHLSLEEKLAFALSAEEALQEIDRAVTQPENAHKPQRINDNQSHFIPPSLRHRPDTGPLSKAAGSQSL